MQLTDIEETLVDRVMTPTALRWTEPKTGKVFRMPLNAELLSLLEQAKSLPRKEGETALLVSGSGKRWSGNAITLAIRRTLEFSKGKNFPGPAIASFSFRSIRKGAAINAARSGINLLGHKQKMLGVYLREETISPNTFD